MEPLVTVAIAAYNVEKFLETGMNYVVNQTYKNLDIILVDDGSTDSTPELCDNIAKTDKRIRVFHKENGGLGSARNVGIDNAKGEYIYFFDVDDSIDLDLIEHNVKDAVEKDVDLIIFGFKARVEGENEEETVSLTEQLITNNSQLKKKYCEELLFTKHGNGFAWNKFYKMSFINKYHFRFGNQRIQQDEPFNMQLYAKLERVYISPNSYYHYVIYNQGNAGTRYLPNRFEIVTEVYHKFKEFYEIWNIDNKNVENYIYHRYASGIIQAVTLNCFHKDSSLSITEKYQYIKSILKNSEVRECAEKVMNYKSKDPVIYCVAKNKPLLLMLVYKVKILIKKIIRR